jgi:hypothetical protein
MCTNPAITREYLATSQHPQNDNENIRFLLHLDCVVDSPGRSVWQYYSYESFVEVS